MSFSSKNEKESDKFLKLLIKCPPDKLTKILHHLVDLFCGQQNSAYNTYADVYSLIEWWDLLSTSRHFFKECYAEVYSVCDKFTSLSPEFSVVLKEILDVRATDLKSSILEKSHEVSPAYLNSFDWKVMFTLASDKMSHINEPRLLLDLDIKGNKNESLRLDLSKDEVKSLIENMEKAKNVAVELMAD